MIHDYVVENLPGNRRSSLEFISWTILSKKDLRLIMSWFIRRIMYVLVFETKIYLSTITFLSQFILYIFVLFLWCYDTTCRRKTDLRSIVNDSTQIVASLESLSSNDKVPSTNHPTNVIQISIPSSVSTNVVTPGNICVFLNESEMQLLKQHMKILTTNKQVYTYAHCGGHDYTQSHCTVLLSGNQHVVPTKAVLPGNYIVFHTPIISNQRIIDYKACNLTEHPRELYPDSSSTLSPAEHSLFQPITDDEIEEEKTTRISPEDPPPATTKSCTIS